jgi:hypothetical protein
MPGIYPAAGESATGAAVAGNFSKMSKSESIWQLLKTSVTTSADHLVTEGEPRTHAAPSPCIAIARSRLAPNDLSKPCCGQYGEACINA